MTEFLVRSAGWNAVVTADHAVDAVDIAVHNADALNRSRDVLGLVIQVLDLDALSETDAALYINSSEVLARLVYAEVETPAGLLVPGRTIQ